MIYICAPRAPIRCHAVNTLCERRRRMAQHDMYHLTCYTFSFTSTKQNTLYIKTDIKNTTNSLLSNSFIKGSYNQHSAKRTKTIPMMTMMIIMYRIFQQVNQHQLLVPKGMNCTPRHQVDYAYAQGMLIMHKPWNKHNTLDHN